MALNLRQKIKSFGKMTQEKFQSFKFERGKPIINLPGVAGKIQRDFLTPETPKEGVGKVADLALNVGGIGGVSSKIARAALRIAKTKNPSIISSILRPFKLPLSRQNDLSNSLRGTTNLDLIQNILKREGGFGTPKGIAAVGAITGALGVMSVAAFKLFKVFLEAL